MVSLLLVLRASLTLYPVGICDTPQRNKNKKSEASDASDVFVARFRSKLAHPWGSASTRGDYYLKVAY